MGPVVAPTSAIQVAFPWQPGQSGNPKGPPKLLPWREMVTKIGTQPVKVKIDGKTVELTRQELIMMAMHNAAAKGDTKAARFIADFTWEKPKQTHEVSGPDGTPIQHVMTHRLSDQQRQIVERHYRDRQLTQDESTDS